MVDVLHQWALFLTLDGRAEALVRLLEEAAGGQEAECLVGLRCHFVFKIDVVPASSGVAGFGVQTKAVAVVHGGLRDAVGDRPGALDALIQGALEWRGNTGAIDESEEASGFRGGGIRRGGNPTRRGLCIHQLEKQ